MAKTPAQTRSKLLFDRTVLLATASIERIVGKPAFPDSQPGSDDSMAFDHSGGQAGSSSCHWTIKLPSAHHAVLSRALFHIRRFALAF